MSWTFFTNHAHVLFLIAKDKDISVRNIALSVGITERAVLRIISNLEEEGYISTEKIGRSNHYKVNIEKTFRHQVEKSCKIKDFLSLIQDKPLE